MNQRRGTERAQDTTAEKLIWLSDNQPIYATKWEQNLLNDRLEAIQTYGLKAIITPKQNRVILDIYFKNRAGKCDPITEIIEPKVNAGIAEEGPKDESKTIP